MGSVFKRNLMKPVPPGATVCTSPGGGEVARWTNAAGRGGRGAVVVTRGGSRKVIVGESKVWFGKVRVSKQRWKTVRLYTDKTASERRLMDLQRDADRRDAGVRTAEMDHAARPLSEHVADYLAALRLEKRNPKTLRLAEWMMEKLVLWGRWRRIADVTPDAMRNILATLDRQQKTASYQNKFVMRAKAFVHWLQREGRIVGDPLVNLKRVDENNSRRTRARRALNDNEVTALLEAAPESRRLKYAFPLLAGIRRSEFRKLLWGDLRMAAPRPFIKLRPEQTKNAKADVLPLHPYLVQLLGELAPGAPDQPVVASVPDMKTMAKDLLAAGVANEVAEAGPGSVSVRKGRHINLADSKGRRTDYHALRHTFSTNLDRTGCSWTTKQALLRHAANGVTEGYSHARIEELYLAIERLPSPLGARRGEKVEAVKTGTGGELVGRQAHHQAHQSPVRNAPSLASTGILPGGDRDSAGWPSTSLITLKNQGDIPHRPELAATGLIVSGTSDILADPRPDTQVD